MGMKLLSNPPQIDLHRQFMLFDHFTEYTTAKTWTTATTGSGTNSISATAQDGVLALAASAATNDCQYVYSTIPLFLWANNVNHAAECLLQFSEASTNNANVFFGFASINTVALLVNSSAGPATSFTGAGIYKTGGSLQWRTVSSQSTTQTLTATNYTAAAQTGYQRLRVEIKITNSIAEVSYFIDQGSTSPPGGMLIPAMNTNNLQRPIKDTITLSSPSTMYLVAGIKNGSANAETLNVDYLAGWKLSSNFVAAT